MLLEGRGNIPHFRHHAHLGQCLASVHFSCSVVSDSFNPMECTMPGLPVHHQLLEPAQTHVHLISDAIQPSHPPSSPSPPAFNLSQHQGLFQGVSSSYLLSLALGKCLHLSGPQFSSVQSFSHVQLFAHPMDCSTSGLPVHHQLPEFTQTHFHQVSDIIQPSHPLLSPSPPAPNPSQHQGLFK